jgi:hypothetical protein
MRYMREQLANEIESDMGSRHMSRQRTASRKPPKVPRNIPCIVPFLVVTPDSTVFMGIPDPSLPAPDTQWDPSKHQPRTVQPPDALISASSSSFSLQSGSSSRRAIEVLGGFSSHFAASGWRGPVGDIGELPNDLGAWTWVSLDVNLVPWWSETFGEPDEISRKAGRSGATSRLRRLFLQQQNISQLEKTLASMVGSHDGDQRAATSPLVRSRSSCEVPSLRQPTSNSFTHTGRRGFSTNSSPRVPTVITPPLHRQGLQQETIVELSHGRSGQSSDLILHRHNFCSSLPHPLPSQAGHSSADVLEES